MSIDDLVVGEPAHPFPLSEPEIQELNLRLREIKEAMERSPVPPELTAQEEKERMRRIRLNRKLATNTAAK